MRKRQFLAVTSAAALAAMMGGGLQARAETPAEFYSGRTVSIFVPVSAGGIYSTFAQVLSNYLGDRIPGKPTIVVKHMPGAGGLKAMNYVYNVAPKDGTALITPLTAMVKSAKLKQGNIKYDPLKYNWFGGWGEAVTVLSLYKEHTPVRTMQDAMKQEVILGAFSKSSNTYLIPHIMNELIGTKFKIILGYKGGSKVRLAIEKGEVTGWSGQWEGWSGRKPEWLEQNKLVHLVQLASKRSAPIPDVPLLEEFAKDDEERQMFRFLQTAKTGRALVAPPGVPADRLAALEKAYQETLADPAFQAAAKKRGYVIDRLSAAEVQGAVREIMNLPPKTTERLRSLMGLTGS